MKFLNYLNEEWAAMFKEDKNAYDIYKNPTKTDLLKLRKSVIAQDDYYKMDSVLPLRFLADPKTEELFVFFHMLLHSDAKNLLYSKNIKKMWDINIESEANLLRDNTMVWRGFHLGHINKEYDWLKKYFKA